MSVAFAILAFLTGGPRSGYDLKKLFVESESLPWSGNNNQVYTALVQLHRDGLASREVQQPEEGPARKVYTITGHGRAVLRAWALAAPELPDCRSPILVQLMAADLLSADEIDRLLKAYEERLRTRLLYLEELQRRGRGPTFGSARRVRLWECINAHPLALVRAELAWLHDVRQALSRVEETS